MKHVKLTYDEHVEIGAQLKRTREELLTLVIRLSRSDGPASPLTKAADRACASVDNLRNRIDNVLCASLPSSDESWRGAYYGGPVVR